MPPGTISPLSPIPTCPDTNTNGPALTAGENGNGWPPGPARVPPRNSTLIGSSDDETKLQFIRFLWMEPAGFRTDRHEYFSPMTLPRSATHLTSFPKSVDSPP